MENTPSFDVSQCEPVTRTASCRAWFSSQAGSMIWQKSDCGSKQERERWEGGHGREAQRPCDGYLTMAVLVRGVRVSPRRSPQCSAAVDPPVLPIPCWCPRMRCCIPRWRNSRMSSAYSRLEGSGIPAQDTAPESEGSSIVRTPAIVSEQRFSGRELVPIRSVVRIGRCWA